MNEETTPAPPPSDEPSPEERGARTPPAEVPESPAPPPEELRPPPPRVRRRNLVPWIYALAFVVLGWAVMFLWLHPTTQVPRSDAQQQLDALQKQVQTLAGEVKGLETRPLPGIQDLRSEIAALRKAEPQAPNLAPLEGKVGALQQQVDDLARQRTAAPAEGGAALAAVQAQLDGLGKRIDAVQQSVPKAPDVSALQSRIATIEKSLPDVVAMKDQLGRVAGRLDQAEKEQQALAGRVQATEAARKSETSDLDKQLQSQDELIAALQKQVQQIAGATRDASELVRAQAAETALAAGRKLGEIPGAPPALARFANEKPPTEADLREAFASAAKAALAAGRPASVDRPFLDRLWARTQDLITVREGDQVIVGDPVAGVIARARSDLDAGDLAGAVAAVSALHGPAAEAMAGWSAKARSVLDARAALADMAAAH